MSAKYVWYDLNTKNLDAAKAFYVAVFGWELMEWTPDGAPEGTPPYTMIAVGGKPFGGMVALGDDVQAPSHWMGHIAVPDVDAAVERARARGAQFPVGTMDIPTVGRFAPMVDPEWCVASLFTPVSDEPMPVPTGDTPGMVGWNELMVADPKAAMAFYTDVVGWKWRKGPFGNTDYYLFGTGEEGGSAGGLLPRPEGVPASSWTQYFTVTSADETVAKVRENGGQVFMPPFEVPDVGRIAVCAGPDGSMFAIGEWKMGA